MTLTAEFIFNTKTEKNEKQEKLNLLTVENKSEDVRDPLT
jgi:hypothetical protein